MNHPSLSLGVLIYSDQIVVMTVMTTNGKTQKDLRISWKDAVVENMRLQTRRPALATSIS